MYDFFPLELRKRHQLDNDTSETSTRPASYDEAVLSANFISCSQFMSLQELISNQQVMDQLEDLEHTSDVRHTVRYTFNNIFSSSPYQEIVRIAQSMAELNGIFKDLNMIVIDQVS